MSYVVLARKYRPHDFEALVGQNSVSQTLLNALSSGRVAHAYVFSGPRGVGKTTTARILAQCLNCDKGTSTTPCNKCPSCLSIAQGTSMQDVMEIDGASNRGIEQIRELRESAKYAPTQSRFRIYIIDEAHQITKDAFGALLKTLEEPPAHVVFMLATTEVQKIPAPILSRCQRFSLRPIAPDLVLNHLKSICQKEKIKIDDEALKDIVRFVEGSLRDALSLLDQALVYSTDGITSQTLRELLGLLPLQTIQNMVNVLNTGDPSEILKVINESIQNGIDLTQLAKDLQNHYHKLLLAKAGVEDAFGSIQKNLATDQFEFTALERNIRLLSRALDEMRYSDTPRAIFEIHALKIGQKILDPRQIIERLEKLEKTGPAPTPMSSPSAAVSAGALSGLRSSAAQVATPAQGPRGVQAKENIQSENFSTKSSGAVAGRSDLRSTGAESSHSTATSASNSFDKNLIQADWSNFITDISHEKASLASALEEAQLLFGDESIILGFHKLFNQQLVARSMDIIKPIFMKRFGSFIPFETRLESNGHTKPPAPADTDGRPPLPEPPIISHTPEEANAPHFEDMAPTEAGSDVQKALKHFPGTLKKVKKPS